MSNKQKCCCSIHTGSSALSSTTQGKQEDGTLTLLTLRTGPFESLESEAGWPAWKAKLWILGCGSNTRANVSLFHSCQASGQQWDNLLEVLYSGLTDAKASLSTHTQVKVTLRQKSAQRSMATLKQRKDTLRTTSSTLPKGKSPSSFIRSKTPAIHAEHSGRVKFKAPSKCFCFPANTK